jgi:hypothetical protein
VKTCSYLLALDVIDINKIVQMTPRELDRKLGKMMRDFSDIIGR